MRIVTDFPGGNLRVLRRDGDVIRFDVGLAGG